MRPDEHKRRKSAQYQNKKKHTASDKHEGKLPVKKDVDENLKRTSTENLVSEYESKCRLISISEIRHCISFHVNLATCMKWCQSIQQARSGRVGNN